MRNAQQIIGESQSSGRNASLKRIRINQARSDRIRDIEDFKDISTRYENVISLGFNKRGAVQRTSADNRWVCGIRYIRNSQSIDSGGETKKVADNAYIMAFDVCERTEHGGIIPIGQGPDSKAAAFVGLVEAIALDFYIDRTAGTGNFDESRIVRIGNVKDVYSATAAGKNVSAVVEQFDKTRREIEPILGGGQSQVKWVGYIQNTKSIVHVKKRTVALNGEVSEELPGRS